MLQVKSLQQTESSDNITQYIISQTTALKSMGLFSAGHPLVTEPGCP